MNEIISLPSRFRVIVKRYFVLVAALTVFLPQLILISSVSAAGTATLTLSPSSGSYTKDKTLTVTIHENSGSTDVNAVEADLGYDKTKLQFVSIDSTASGFDTPFVETGGSGTVQIVRLKLATSLSGDQVVAAVNFKVLVGSGSTAITFLSNSGVSGPIPSPPYSQDFWDHNTSGGTYTLKGNSTGTGSGSGSTSGSSSGGTSTSIPTSVSKKAKQAAPSATVAVVGYNVAIKVVDQNEKPLSGASVTLQGRPPVLTSENGLAGFTQIHDGTYNVSVSHKGVSVDQSITVTKSASATVQTFTVVINTKTSIAHPLLWPGVGLLSLIFLLFVIRRILKLRQHKRDANFYAQNTPANPQQPEQSADISPGQPDQANAKVGVVYDGERLKRPKF